MRNLILTLAAVLLVVPTALAQTAAAAGAKTPCSLVTKAEVQEAIGAGVVGDAQPNKTNPAVCDFKVGDFGGIGVMLVQSAGQTADQIIAGLKQRKVATADAPGIGDRSFFASPGYGTVQLNTFKGAHYVIVTVLVPGLDEAKAKAVATKVMQKAVTRL